MKDHVLQIGTEVDRILPISTFRRMNPGIGGARYQLPEDIIDLYRWHDGENACDPFDPIMGFHFLSVNECLKETDKLRKDYSNIEHIGNSWVIGNGYANSLVLAISPDSLTSKIGYLFLEEGLCIGAHDSVLSMMKTTLETWRLIHAKQVADFELISRDFSACAGIELWRF